MMHSDLSPTRKTCAFCGNHTLHNPCKEAKKWRCTKCGMPPKQTTPMKAKADRCLRPYTGQGV